MAQSGEAEVVFAVKFNHGGGYAYRLCPADQPLTSVLKSHHLGLCREAGSLFRKLTAILLIVCLRGHKP